MPKGLPWFRMYAEFAFDPKIQSMGETLQRRYAMFLCLKCNGDIPGLTDETAACALRISLNDLLETKKMLISIGLICENFEINNWDKRQYRSDSSTDRVKKFRGKKLGGKRETLQKRYRNRNVTPLSVSVSESVSDSIPQKNERKDIDVLADHVLDSLKIPMSDKGKTEVLLKTLGLDSMIYCVDRMKLYFDEVKKNKWSNYIIGKHWRNLYEKIEYFSSDENLYNKLVDTERANSKKEKVDCRTVSTDFSSDEEIMRKQREKKND